MFLRIAKFPNPNHSAVKTPCYPVFEPTQSGLRYARPCRFLRNRPLQLWCLSHCQSGLLVIATFIYFYRVHLHTPTT